VQGPIPGADIKSNGFIPKPGSEHWSGERYEPVIRPDGLVTIVSATPEMIAAINADRAGHHQVSGGGSNGGGSGGGHDGQVAAACMSIVLRLLRAGAVPGDRMKQAAYAEWLKIAIPHDPAWPFDWSDFERHFRSALPKAQDVIARSDAAERVAAARFLAWIRGGAAS
jgi:hypothetical protein